MKQRQGQYVQRREEILLFSTMGRPYRPVTTKCQLLWRWPLPFAVRQLSMVDYQRVLRLGLLFLEKMSI